MVLYAHENHGEYPRTLYSPGDLPWFFATSGNDLPFERGAGSPRYNELTAAYFLLVQYRLLPVGVFVCPSTDHQKDPLDLRNDPSLRSNFVRTDPLGKDFSYSFANPFPGDSGTSPMGNTYRYRPTDPPDLALAADRNDGERWRTSTPDAPRSMIGPMNSSNHKRKGQNVLFNDQSVRWEETPFCGHARDNIWTRSDMKEGTIAMPTGKDDSVLSPMFPLKDPSGF
jgi:hypothetical protein